ncbi:HD domain-containing phosphohydrolase [Paenibacillus sp. FSL R7-0204]|uniref:HD-GYP domain-containing protein n=1 Tax=Paenibacillus sp. FSL R7-0204 TaxID=2921675 RepID=UPI0030F5FEEB
MILTFVELSKNTELNHIIDRLRQEDDYTYKHSIVVALISGIIGTAIGLLDLELSDLTGAAFLHDIGKTRISKEVLNKPGKLTSDEFNQMKNHTIYGFEIIRSLGIPHRHALVALQHHEREDGSGYPLGIKGSDIAPYSKIVNSSLLSS